MIAKSLALAALIVAALLIWLLQELVYLAPYRAMVLDRIAVIGGFLALLFFNLAAALHTLFRWLLLSDTGRKLSHLERQLASGDAVPEGLTERLQEARR